MAYRLQKFLLIPVNLTVYKYCSLRKGHKNTFAFALKYHLKSEFNFNLTIF